MTIQFFLLTWAVAAVVAGIAIGHFIHVGGGADDQDTPTKETK